VGAGRRTVKIRTNVNDLSSGAGGRPPPVAPWTATVVVTLKLVGARTLSFFFELHAFFDSNLDWVLWGTPEWFYSGTQRSIIQPGAVP
jgi:hypothetical protein